MTNDEIRARSRAAYREAFNGTGSEYDDFVNATARAIADAVTAALEEAAKVADERAANWQERADESEFEGKLIANRSRDVALNIAVAIRALKPVSK